jgi:hypothetical protein
MQASEKLRYELGRYHALRQHHDETFRQRLHALQSFQARRLQHTHAALVADPQFRDATGLFLTDIYGGIDLMPMAREIERALPMAMRILPDSVLHTSATALEIMVLIQSVDEALAALYFEQQRHSEPQLDAYISAVRALGRFDERRRVLTLVRELGHGLDKYVRSRIIFGTFRLAAKPAHKYGLGALYDFLDRGFRVMRPIGSTLELFDGMARDEELVLQRLESGAADPFLLAGKPL